MHEEATNISIPGTVATSTTTTQNQNDTTETITINNDEVHLDMTPEDNNENLDVPFSSETPESKIAREIGVDIVRNISLPCLLSNKNVMWVHEGKGAVINPLHVLENGSLSLTQVDRKDSGVYTCSVDGEDDASVRLRVRTPPPQLSFTVHPSTILALLIWTVNETGGYPIIYFTAQYRLGNSDEEWKIISPTRISPNIRQIEVYKLEPNTTYGFQIWATNQLGKGEITEVHEHALFNNQELELARHFLEGADKFDTRMWLIAVAVVMGTLALLAFGTCLLLYQECRTPNVTDVEASIDGGGSQSVMDMTMGHCYSLAPNAVSSAEIPDTKFGIEELCPVCGDKVSGYHYGLLTCESCKGFFKRTVQNKKVYTCVAERSCHIDKTQRKRCPFCRFQKCLEVGMKLEAVRADRMRGGRNKFGPMYKRDRARKLQIMRQRQLAIQALAQRGQLGEGGVYNNQAGTSPFNNIHIKQEIQIPQVSSLTSSPDSPSSPNAVVLGQVSSAIIQPTSSQQSSLLLGVSGTQSPVVMGPDGKIWSSANSTTTSPHSLSPKTFHFDTVLPGGSVPPSSKISPLIRDFVQAIDDREWQNSLYSLLQNQTYNQCEVDLFELMCKVLDQNLFSQVDWARNSIIFKELKVDDQMKLLQHSWSDMLVLDHMHQRMHNNLPDETTLHNGQKFDLLSLGLLGVSVLADPFNNITAKLLELKFDVSDYICVKFLLLLNPDVRGITNRKLIQDGYDQVHQALLDYTVTCYPQIPYKFHKLLQLLPEMHSLATRGEEHLYHKHCTGGAPTQTLLMEMLHAKRK